MELASGRPHRFIDPGTLRSPSQAIAPQNVPPFEKIEPPLPPRKERPFTNFLSGFLSLIVILSLIAVGIFFYVERQIEAPGPLTDDRVATVRGGSADVIDQLEREGVIDKPFLFALYLQVTGKSAQIKAGEYLFKKEASLADVTQTLVEGKSLLHPVTIPEGRTSQQIVEILAGEESLIGDVKVVPKEGTLMPETYKVARGMTRPQLLDRMAQEYAKLVKDVWAHRAPDLPLSTPQELITLASVVEKETAKADERPRIAAVFINRLQRGMKLQSDPTIIYGLVGGKGTLGRPISKADMDSVTPYNTYVVPGLPAGPICNPGRAALEAVANPSKTKELYFVADGTGGHVFAETFEQHQKNVQRWRQIESSGGSAPAAAPAPAAVPEKIAEPTVQQTAPAGLTPQTKGIVTPFGKTAPAPAATPAPKAEAPKVDAPKADPKKSAAPAAKPAPTTKAKPKIIPPADGGAPDEPIPD